MKIAYFISSHGFGHAARACAVMHALAQAGDFEFLIFSETPEWFFQKSLNMNFIFFPLKTDIGLIQKSPFEEDLLQTVHRLREYFPLDSKFVYSVADLLLEYDIKFVLTDISVLGILAGEWLKIPTVLIENFTWDWIYESYVEEFPCFREIISYLQEIYKRVAYRIQAIPYCESVDHGFKVPPIFRKESADAQQLKVNLGIGKEKLILVTMGGIPLESVNLFSQLQIPDTVMLVTGGNVNQITRVGNLIQLPHSHNFFHPDLVHQADMVIGKVGYSTIAEVYSTNTPFLYYKRPKFRESRVLEEYIKHNLVGESINEDDFLTGNIFHKIEKYLNLKRKGDVKFILNGADAVVDFLRWKKLIK
jgi:UDP-N-acetylglucosamine:LPS N-acetylglucosamine transferase